MKYETMTNVEYHMHYDSFSDILEDTGKSVRNERARAGVTVADSGLGSDWYGLGIKTPKQFLEVVGGQHSGIVESLVRSAETYNKELHLKLPLTSSAAPVKRRQRVRSDFGNSLDIHRVYQGQLDKAWDRSIRVDHMQQRRRATLFVNIGGLGNVKATSSLWRAAAAYRMCDELQKQGYTVEIICGAVADRVYASYRGKTVTSFTAKLPNMPIDLKRVALQSMLGWHRVFNFMARACNNEALPVEETFGYTVSDHTPTMIQKRQEAGELAVVMSSHIFERHSAQNALDNCAEAFTSHSQRSAA